MINERISVYDLFPIVIDQTDLKSRIKFIYNLTYCNYWESTSDIYEYSHIHFEKLYQYYLKTELVPYFTPMIVSFIKYVDEFVDSNNSKMYIVKEELLRDWFKP
jgi:hypothetical protein